MIKPKFIRPKTITVQFADSFTEKPVSNVIMTFTYCPVMMMRGEIRDWINTVKPVLEKQLRRKDRLHGILITHLTYTY